MRKGLGVGKAQTGLAAGLNEPRDSLPSIFNYQYIYIYIYQRMQYCEGSILPVELSFCLAARRKWRAALGDAYSSRCMLHFEGFFKFYRLLREKKNAKPLQTSETGSVVDSSEAVNEHGL